MDVIILDPPTTIGVSTVPGIPGPPGPTGPTGPAYTVLFGTTPPDPTGLPDGTLFFQI